MTRATLGHGFALLAVCLAVACGGGGIGSDGGRSGTGISAVVRGTVVSTPSTGPDVGGIRITVTGTSLAATTGADGRFELSGEVSGPVELRFERAPDGLSARANVVIPSGGVLVLDDIQIDQDSGQANPGQQQVQFEGIVTTLDCAGGTFQVRAKDDQTATVFTVQVASAVIREDTVPLACDDLRVDDRLQVTAETPDGLVLVNATITREKGGDDPGNQHVELQGIVSALDCSSGNFRVVPKDDGAATVFTVQTATAKIREGVQTLGCADLHLGDEVQVTARSSDGTTLVDATVVRTPDDPNPDPQRVELQGIVTALDCRGNAIRITPQDDDTAIVFIVDVTRATIREGTTALACGDLQIGDRVQVDGLTTDGVTLVEATVVREEDDGGGGSHEVQFEGLVMALDCVGGTIRVLPNDDGATTVLLVEVASATIRQGATILACRDLRVSDRVQVTATTSDGITLVGATVVRELDDGGGGGSDQDVQFEGVVTTLDCTAGSIRLTPKDDDAATVFLVEVASATIREEGTALGCTDLRVGDQVQVTAVTPDGTTLVDATLVRNRDPNGGNEHVELQGTVTAVDCAHGLIRIAPHDDGATTIFGIDVTTATLRDSAGAALACGDFRINDQVQVTGSTPDGTTIVDATVIREREAGAVQFQATIVAVDCASGAIRIRPNDDDTAIVYVIDVASATFREDATVLACGDLRVDDQVQVTGTVREGTSVVDATVFREANGDGQ